MSWFGMNIGSSLDTNCTKSIFHLFWISKFVRGLFFMLFLCFKALIISNFMNYVKCSFCSVAGGQA